MKLAVGNEVVRARLMLAPVLEYETGADPGGAIAPGDSFKTLQGAGIALVAASARERAWLRRHGFRLPERESLVAAKAPATPGSFRDALRTSAPRGCSRD